MIRINLVPRYYFEQRVIRRMILMFCGLLLLLITGLGFYAITLKHQIAKTDEELRIVDAKAKEVEELRRQAQEATNSVAPLVARIKFVNDVEKYNVSPIPIIHDLTRYTYQKIQYKSITIADDGDSVTVQGHAPNLMDAGRYLLGMYRATHLFSTVTISGVPGYGAASGGQSANAPADQASGFDFSAVLKLKSRITKPVFAGGGGTATPETSVPTASVAPGVQTPGG